ncbi:alpha/beta fold hydrolase [Collimonas antrihumi]|nr:hypothetical protein [Collimonas antrihumi]
MAIQVAMSQTLANGIPGARLEVLKDASHLSYIEQPQAFSQVVRSFIGNL